MSGSYDWNWVCIGEVLHNLFGTNKKEIPCCSEDAQMTRGMESLFLKKESFNPSWHNVTLSLICSLSRRLCDPKCSQQWSRPGCHTDCCSKRNKHNQCHQRQVETLNLLQLQHIWIYDGSLIALFSFLKTRVHTAQWKAEGHRSNSRDQRRGTEKAWDEGTV